MPSFLIQLLFWIEDLIKYTKLQYIWLMVAILGESCSNYIPSFGAIKKFKIITTNYSLLKVFGEIPPYYVEDIILAAQEAKRDPLREPSYSLIIEGHHTILNVSEEYIEIDGEKYERTEYYNPSLKK